MRFYLPPLLMCARFDVVRWLCAAAFGWLAVSAAAQLDPLMSVDDPSVVEGNAGSTNLIFNIQLSEPSTQSVTVDFYTFGLTATPGLDFISTNGTVTFDPGVTNQQVIIQILGDLLNEGNEVLWLYLTNETHALLVDNRGDGTIVDDDPLPALSASSVVVQEGDAGSTNAVFNVSLSAPSGRTVTVQFNTISLSAAAGADFTPQSDVLTFPSGATNQIVVVQVLGDLLNEDNEQFGLNLTNASNAGIAPGLALATIVDNDPLPGLTIADFTLVEGTGGTTNAALALSLNAPSGRNLSVDFQTQSGSANAGSDFTATNGTLVFSPGKTNLTLPIAVITDSTIETVESFTVNLSNPTNVSLLRSQATVTILDDELRTLTFTNAVPFTIPDFGAATPYPAPIEVSGLVGTVVKVAVTLPRLTHSFPDDLDILLVGPGGRKCLLMSDCGAGNNVNNVTLTLDDAAAAALPDNGQITSGTFQPTDFSATDVLAGPAPGGPYGSELSVFKGVNPNGAWQLFVYDDSPGGAGSLSGWRLSLTLSNLVCCTGGNADLSVTVSDSPDPVTASSNVTFTARIINNGPSAASNVTLTNLLPAGMSLVAASTTHGSLSTNASAVTGNLGNLGLGVQATVSLVARTSVAGNFTNNIIVHTDTTDPDMSNNTALTPTAANLLAPLLFVNSPAVAEGDLGVTNLNFSITLSRTNNVTVTAGYSIVAGTATVNDDFLPSSDGLTFPPGVTNLTLSVPVFGDITVEPSETVLLQITGITNGLIATSQATGTIVNDDGLLQKVQQFSFSAISTTQYLGVAFPITITARDISNNVATTFAGPAKLSGVTGGGADVSIVIAEIDTDGDDSVEFANVCGSAIDVSGWQVTLYDWINWPAPAATFSIPAGTVCGSNQVFTLTDNGNAPGSYPTFSLGLNLFWNNDDSTNMVAVLLRDAEGRIVDFFCAVDAYPGEITSPVPIPVSQWSGAPEAANTDPSLTYQRTDGMDSNQQSDFITAARGIGAMNAGITLPFAGRRPILAAPGTATNFQNGVWSGNVMMLQGGTNISLRAMDSPGHVGYSTAFTVLPGVDLGVTISASSSAVVTGQAVTFTLRATNAGSLAASGVVLTNRLPSGFNFVTASTTQGSYTQAGGLVTFNLGSLAIGAVATATVQAAPASGGNFTNNCGLYAATVDSRLTNNSAVIVISANSPPVFSAMPTQFVNEGSTLTVTNQAGDPDVPPNVLTFSLLSGPPGATVSTNGIFSWTTTESDGPGTNTVTVKVQDNGNPSLAATQSWAAVVREVNQAPVLQPVADRTVDELTTLIVTNIATDPDLPANNLSFTLLSAPPGATLSSGGVFSWTPSEQAGPGNYFVSIKVQDNGSPILAATQTWAIVVNEVNQPPNLLPVTNRIIDELTTVVITNTATDPDFPANELEFVLLSGPPGATLSTNGVFSWTPGESDGPGTYPVAIRVTDDGSPGLSAYSVFHIVVNEVNQAPVLQPISNQVVLPNVTLLLTNSASDADVPTNTLTFALVSAPPGAGVNAGGVFSWTPGDADSGTTNLITLRVYDDGVPSLSATQSFLVAVLNVNTQQQLRIDRIERGAPLVTLPFAAPAGYSFLVESRPASGGNWLALSNIVVSPVTTNVVVRSPVASQPRRFFRARNVTIPYQPPALGNAQVSNGVFGFTLTADLGRSYVVEARTELDSGSWLVVTNFAFSNVNVPMNYSGTQGGDGEPRAFRVTQLSLPVPAHRFDRIERVGATLNIYFTLAPGLPCAVEYSTNLLAPVWIGLTNIPSFSARTPMRLTDATPGAARFYRLNLQVPSQPVTPAAPEFGLPMLNLWFNAEANKSYTMQYRDSAGGGNWLDLQAISPIPTNGARVVSDPASAPQRFYRLKQP